MIRTATMDKLGSYAAARRGSTRKTLPQSNAMLADWMRKPKCAGFAGSDNDFRCAACGQPRALHTTAEDAL